MDAAVGLSWTAEARTSGSFNHRMCISLIANAASVQTFHSFEFDAVTDGND